MAWFGLATGCLALLAGTAAMLGRAPRAFSLPARVPAGRLRLLRPLAFGAAYAIASLGCSLLVFLAFLASALAVRGSGNALAVLAAYMAGIATTVVALVLVARLLREGLGRRLVPLAAHLHRVSALLLLLVLAGGYLTYFWARLEFGSSATIADDPIRVRQRASSLFSPA